MKCPSEKQIRAHKGERLKIVTRPDVPLAKPDWTIHDKNWLAQVVKKSSRSGEALARILDDGKRVGLKQDYLLYLLYHYCKSAEVSSIEARRTLAGSRTRKLRKILTACECLTNCLCDTRGRIETSFASPVLGTRVGPLCSLISYANYLRFQIEIEEATATHKGSGLNDALLYQLAAEIEHATGQPHLGKIAVLVEAGLMALDLKQGAFIALARKDLRARLQRFEKLNEHEASTISTFVSCS